MSVSDNGPAAGAPGKPALVVLISTYELGRQPFGLASPAAWLREDGFDVHMLDLTRVPLDEDLVRQATVVGFHLQMHTATRLAVPMIRRVRALNPSADVCAYGLYAPPNAELMTGLGVREVIGGEFEADLLEFARKTRAKAVPAPGGAAGATQVIPESLDPDAVPHSGWARPRSAPRLAFRVPDRQGLPSLAQYAKLHFSGGRERAVGYTEATRGCRHLCRHCPVVPIYGGQFRIVPLDVVIADIRQQVEAGAAHVTFGDPDFLNGPRHAMDIVVALHREWPELSYDVTIKIEHLLRNPECLSRLASTGCLFVTSAVEALDDRVLALLDKRHTRDDVALALDRCRGVGLTLSPTFVAFTPWTTPAAYLDLLDTLVEWDMVDDVAPIQLAIRLLVPRGSRLLELDDTRRFVGDFDPATLAFPWRHPEPVMDDLQRQLEELVGGRGGTSRRVLFDQVRALAQKYLTASATAPPGQPSPSARPSRRAAPSVPRRQSEVAWLDEPWYCCAEPTREQVPLL